MGPQARTRSKVAAGKKAAKATAVGKSAGRIPAKVTKKVATKKSTATKPKINKAKAEPVEDAIPENNARLDPEHVKQLKLIRKNVNKWRKYLSDAIKNGYCCSGLLQVEDVFFHATTYLHGINVEVGFYEPKEEAEPEETEAETESETEPEPEYIKTQRRALGPAAAYC
ncbi:hypothetical protein BDV97DRAFT_399347 [Delphinella strobiligena]|nr:hypothetical protein BDV97DRAFT_399347 [Delphinella strobiligena]